MAPHETALGEAEFAGASTTPEYGATRSLGSAIVLMTKSPQRGGAAHRRWYCKIQANRECGYTCSHSFEGDPMRHPLLLAACAALVLTACSDDTAVAPPTAAPAAPKAAL